MFCKECGAEIEGISKFCPKCGAKIVQKQSDSDDAMAANGNDVNDISNAEYKDYGDADENYDDDEYLYEDAEEDDEEEYEEEYIEDDKKKKVRNKYLVESDEKIIDTIGTGFALNFFISGVFKQWTAVLSDKRLYVRGTMYEGSVRTLFVSKSSKTLDLEDITATGFVYSSMSWITIILTAIMFLITTAITVALFSGEFDSSQVMFDLLITVVFEIIAVLLSRKTWFFIEYAGGRINLDALLFSVSTCEHFEKKIRRAKDRSLGKNK